MQRVAVTKWLTSAKTWKRYEPNMAPGHSWTRLLDNPKASASRNELCNVLQAGKKLER